MAESDDEGAFASADEGEESGVGKTADTLVEQQTEAVAKDTKSGDTKSSTKQKDKKNVSGAADNTRTGASHKQSEKSQKKKQGKKDSKGKQPAKMEKPASMQPEMAKNVDSKDTDEKTSKAGSVTSASQDKKQTEVKTPDHVKSVDKKEGEGKPENVAKSTDKKAENTDDTDRQAENTDEIGDTDRQAGNTDKIGDTDRQAGNTDKIGDTDRQAENTDKIGDTDRQAENTDEIGDTDRQAETTDEIGDSQSDVVMSPEEQSILRPEPDHTRGEEAILERLSDSAVPGQVQVEPSGWSWGGWGTSLVRTASTSVSTFTSQVGEGFNTLLESVETTLGVPMPEEMAKPAESTTSESQTAAGASEISHDNGSGDAKGENSGDAKGENSGDAKGENSASKEGKEESPESNKTEQASSEGSSWFSAWGVSNITNMVQNTSKKVVHGGLEVLETIGKKTYGVISETDPGFAKTRKLVNKGEKPTLSQLLRDAKDQAEHNAQKDKEAEECRKAHFGALFDDFQGLAHLEALEMLSNQSEKKVQSLLAAVPSEVMATIKPELLQIKETFELQDDDTEDEPEDQDFVQLVTDSMSKLHVGLSPDKLTRCQENTRKWISEFYSSQAVEQLEVKDIHQMAIQTLAEMTSKAVEQFHKSGELILTRKDSETEFVVKAKSLAGLTKVLSTEIGIMSTMFSKCLHKAGESHGQPDSAITPMVTNVYLEASNSRTYVEDAFQLLLPVLQQSAIENSKELAQ